MMKLFCFLKAATKIRDLVIHNNLPSRKNNRFYLRIHGWIKELYQFKTLCLNSIIKLLTTFLCFNKNKRHIIIYFTFLTNSKDFCLRLSKIVMYWLHFFLTECTWKIAKFKFFYFLMKKIGKVNKRLKKFDNVLKKLTLSK